MSGTQLRWRVRDVTAAVAGASSSVHFLFRREEKNVQSLGTAARGCLSIGLFCGDHHSTLTDYWAEGAADEAEVSSSWPARKSPHVLRARRRSCSCPQRRERAICYLSIYDHRHNSELVWINGIVRTWLTIVLTNGERIWSVLHTVPCLIQYQ